MRCGVLFPNYARLVVCAPQTDIPRYLEQNVDDAVILPHSNSEDTAMAVEDPDYGPLFAAFSCEARKSRLPQFPTAA